MDLERLNYKLILGIVYLMIISVGLYFIFSNIDAKDLMSYEFIKSNKDVILKYKNDHFLFFQLFGFCF